MSTSSAFVSGLNNLQASSSASYSSPQSTTDAQPQKSPFALNQRSEASLKSKSLLESDSHPNAKPNVNLAAVIDIQGAVTASPPGAPTIGTGSNAPTSTLTTPDPPLLSKEMSVLSSVLPHTHSHVPPSVTLAPPGTPTPDPPPPSRGVGTGSPPIPPTPSTAPTTIVLVSTVHANDHDHPHTHSMDHNFEASGPHRHHSHVVPSTFTTLVDGEVATFTLSVDRTSVSSTSTTAASSAGSGTTLSVLDTGPSPSGAVHGSANRNVGAIVGPAVGVLALVGVGVLVVMLFLRRRRRWRGVRLAEGGGAENEDAFRGQGMREQWTAGAAVAVPVSAYRGAPPSASSMSSRDVGREETNPFDDPADAEWAPRYKPEDTAPHSTDPDTPPGNTLNTSPRASLVSGTSTIVFAQRTSVGSEEYASSVSSHSGSGTVTSGGPRGEKSMIGPYLSAMLNSSRAS